MNQTEWDKARGEICPECQEEALRFIEGICFSCYSWKIMERDKKIEDRAERRYFQRALNRGEISMKDLRDRRLRDTQR